MVEEPYKRMHLPSELEQAPLSTDLDWMLSSSQTSVALILETVIHEYYPSLYRLASTILDDPHLVGRAIRTTLIRALVGRHRFNEQVGFRRSLFQILIQTCRRLQSKPPPKSLDRAGDGAGVIDLSRAPSPNEAELWQMVDDLNEFTRSTILLHYLLDFPASEIGPIMGISEAEVTSDLENPRRWLQMCRPDQIVMGEEADRWIASAFQRRWPPINLSEEELSRIIDSVLRSLDQRSQKKRLLTIIQQVLIALGVVVILAIGGWITNRSFPQRKSQKVIYYVTATPRASSALIPYNIPTPRPNNRYRQSPWLLAQQPEPLTAFSTPAEIRQRIFESRSLWTNVWVDAQLIRYGPPGFGGPAQVYRNLLWIRNPTRTDPTERRLVIAGTAEGGPQFASLLQDKNVSEVDLHRGLQYEYALGETNPFYDVIGPDYRGMYGFDLRGVLDGSYLSSMLFGAGLVSLPGDLRVLGPGRMMGRDVLIVLHQLQGGQMEQFWLEAHTGMVLRWRGYSDQSFRDVLAEIRVTDIELGAMFPEYLLSSSSILHLPVSWQSLENAKIPLGPTDTAPSPSTTDQHTPNISPPAGFDPSKSCLIFQWPQTVEKLQSLSNPVGLFADGYYLGEVQMGDPWQIHCERSANGDLVACIDPPTGLESVLYAESTLYWFRLNDLGQVHRVVTDPVWVGNDFAFSPDGHYLAFWQCSKGQTECGIYLQDTTTLKTNELISLPHAATFFMWSPDSRDLAFVGTGQSLRSAIDFDVVRVGTGEILYDGPFVWPDMSIPPDSPVYHWGLTFPPPDNKFNSCAQTR